MCFLKGLALHPAAKAAGFSAHVIIKKEPDETKTLTCSSILFSIQ